MRSTAFWRRFGNLPRFMTYLERVDDLGEGRSHWVAKGPAGMRVEWDAEIINEVENKVIGWRTLPGSNRDDGGIGQFRQRSKRPGYASRRCISSTRRQPGAPAALVAQLFGREPSQTIREDLRRFKQLLEAGEIPRAAINHRAAGVHQ